MQRKWASAARSRQAAPAQVAQARQVGVVRIGWGAAAQGSSGAGAAGSSAVAGSAAEGVGSGRWLARQQAGMKRVWAGSFVLRCGRHGKERQSLKQVRRRVCVFNQW